MTFFRLWLSLVTICVLGIMLGGSVPVAVTRSLMAGPLAITPKTCSAGSLFIATDQPLGQQQYICGGGNVWFQTGSLGKSGGLLMVKGVIDINPDVVPFVWNANTFKALQRLQAGLSLKTSNKQPDCTLQTDGWFWHTSGNTVSVGANGLPVPLTKDVISACVFNGKTYNWVTLY